MKQQNKMMLKLVLLCCAATSIVCGHNNKQANDADLQAGLMPEELNPVFVPDGDQPWRSILPLPRPRARRNSELALPPIVPESSLIQQVKSYSRIIACVVLALSAIIEIVVYGVEMYYS